MSISLIAEDKLRSKQRGEVVACTAETLLVEFPSGRCENCSCSFSFTSATGSTGNESKRVSFQLSELKSSFPEATVMPFRVGQQVELSVCANHLRLGSALLFGLPLVFAFVGGVFARFWSLMALGEGVLVMLGFAFGALISLWVSSASQQKFYDRLAITPLDC